MANLFESPEFVRMPEEEQLGYLRSKSPEFSAYHDENPEGALEMMRSRTGKRPSETSVVGDVIRQFGSGVGESIGDVVALPFDAAEWVASKAGSEWSTDIDDRIEAFQREKFPEPTTDPGKVARSVGYWSGMGLQTYLSGGGLAFASRFPTRAAGGLAKAGRFISGGAKVEMGAAVAGGAAEGAVEIGMEDTNPAKPWYKIGAALLASGGTGIAIAARGAAKRSRVRSAGGEQPPTPSGGDLPSPADLEAVRPKVGGAERIVSPVIVVNGKVFRGRTHGEAISNAMDAGAVVESDRTFLSTIDEGDFPLDTFETSSGRVVRRDEADRLFGINTSEDLSRKVVSLDAVDELRTDEMREILGTGQGGLSYDDFVNAAQESGEASMRNMMDDTYSVLSPERMKNVVDGVSDVMARGDIPIDINKPFYPQLANVISSGRITTKEANDILRNFDTDIVSIRDLELPMMSSARTAGQTLNVLSQASKRLRKRLTEQVDAGDASPEEVAMLKAMGGPDTEVIAAFNSSTLGKRWENIRRGGLVTQLATMMRNYEVQALNLTIHGMEDTMEAGMHQLLKIAGKPVNPAYDTNAWGSWLRMTDSVTSKISGKPTTSKSFKQVREMEDYYTGTKAVREALEEAVDSGAATPNNLAMLRELHNPKHKPMESAAIPGFATYADELNVPMADRMMLDPLVGSFNADILINPRGGLTGMAERWVLKLNTMNRAQEHMFRRSVMTAELDRVLAAKGQSLESIIDAGGLGSLDRSDIKQAIGKAMEATYAEEFLPNMSGAAGIAGKAIAFINSAGIGPVRLTQVIPFPRFMANSIKWQYQHSPLGLLKYAYDPTEWSRLAAGDVKPLVKAATGMAMYHSALQVRDSEFAGEKWYEIRPSDQVNEALGREPGSTIDVRPFNPFASYLYVADLVKRSRDETLPRMTTRDMLMGIASVNLRAGAGMYVMDKFLDGIMSGVNASSNPEEDLKSALVQGGSEYLGAAWGGMFVPFQQLRDLASSFDEMLGTDNRTLRDTSEAPLAGAIARKIPYADETLPEVQLPTRRAAPRTEGGLLRQLTGMTMRGPKNAAEKEFDRLAFTRSNILPGSGNKKWDALRAKHMGPIVEDEIAPLVASAEYQKRTNDEKTDLLQRWLKSARAMATAKASEENQELAIEMKIAGMKRHRRRMFRAQERENEVEERRAVLSEEQQRQSQGR
jgi:hypothetical protein